MRKESSTVQKCKRQMATLGFDSQLAYTTNDIQESCCRRKRQSSQTGSNGRTIQRAKRTARNV